MERWKDFISYEPAQPLNLPRLSHGGIEAVDRFIDAASLLIGKHNYEDSWVVNADESPATVMNSEDAKAITNAENVRSGIAKEDKDWIRTILPFVTAAGQVLLVVYIFADNNSDDDLMLRRVALPKPDPNAKPLWPSYYAVTRKGFIVKELWTDIVNVLLSLTESKRAGKRMLLVVDRHSTHWNIDSLRKLG